MTSPILDPATGLPVDDPQLRAAAQNMEQQKATAIASQMRAADIRMSVNVEVYARLVVDNINAALARAVEERESEMAEAEEEGDEERLLKLTRTPLGEIPVQFGALAGMAMQAADAFIGVNFQVKGKQPDGDSTGGQGTAASDSAA